MGAGQPSAAHTTRRSRGPTLLNVTSLIVLIAGVLAVLIAYDVGGIRNTANGDNPPIRNEPADVPVKQKTVPVTRAAANTAIRFIDTAVSRKNLAESYRLVTPAFRQGKTLAQWSTGNIPVPYFAVWSKGAGYSPYDVLWSYENDLMLRILLTPREGLGFKREDFWIGLKRANRSAPWKVYYFDAYFYPPRPQGREDAN